MVGAFRDSSDLLIEKGQFTLNQLFLFLVSYQPRKRVSFLVRPGWPFTDGLTGCLQALLPGSRSSLVQEIDGCIQIPIMDRSTKGAVFPIRRIDSLLCDFD